MAAIIILVILLKVNNEKRSPTPNAVYTVSFQDIEKTNVLLKQAGVYESVDKILPDSLCKILGVDAVIKSSWSYSKTGSEAGAIASVVLLGVAKGTASGQLVMQIYDGKSGEMVWRMAKEMNEGVFPVPTC